MGNDNDGDAKLLVDLSQKLQHLLGGVRVEGAGGLVRQQKLRISGQRSGNTDALLLATGQLLRVVVTAIAQTNELQQLLDSSLAFTLRHSGKLQGVFNVSRSCTRRQQIKLLENHADASSNIAQLLFRHTNNVGFADQNLPTSGSFKAVDHTNKGGFAGARVADNANDFARLDRQVNVVERSDAAALGVKNFGQVAKFYARSCRHGGPI